MSTITVRVTEKHIRTGRRRDMCRCPEAFAIREATGVHADIIPHARRVEVHLPDGIAVCTLLEDAAERGLAFDRTGVMEPFEFDVEIPGWEGAAA